MNQAERDRLVTLRKAKKRLITQRQAAEELGISVRQVKRLLVALKKRGDKVVIHGLRGQPSKRKIDEEDATPGDEDLVGRGVPRLRADAGERRVGAAAQDRREQGDGAEVDDGGEAVAGREAED
jgi:biotin operon repressor